MLNNKILLNEQNPTIVGKWSPIPKATKTTTSKSSVTSSIPEFLGNIDGVKKFQEWLDQNHPGWATGYPNGILKQAGGYGRFGPRTKAAWNSKKGEEYKKSGAATLSTPETGTGAGQSEDEKWIDDKIAKGFFTGGIKQKLKSGHIVYRKPAKSIKGDSEPVGVGFYYFLKGDELPFPWRKYANVDGDYIEVDRGTYEFSDITPEFKEESLSEQIIVSREKEPAQTTGTSSPTATPSGQSGNAARDEAFKNYRIYFNKIGILDDYQLNRPDENRVSAIYDGILSAIKKGYQSESFYFFKEGLKFLKSLYPNQYAELDPNEIKTVVSVSNFIDYPEDSINQLRNPISRKSEFKEIPLGELISAFPSSTPSGRYVYIWPNLVTPDDIRSLTAMTTNVGEINDEDCAKQLKAWYLKFIGKDKIDANGAKIYKNYLMECNNKCKFVNKDEAFFNRMFKTGKEKSADRMVKELKSENAGVYNVPFADVRESCKRLGRETRVEGKSANNLKKMIRENLITEKTKKQRLLKESKIIKNRLYVLLEDKTKLKSQADYNKLFNSLIVEANFLREQGFDEKLIQESWFSFLGKLGFGGFADTLQEKLIQWVLKTLGVPKNSVINDILVTGFANFDLDNIAKILSGDCNSIVKLIARTTVDTFIKQKTSKGGKTNHLEDILRNSITDLLLNDKSNLMKTVEDKLLSFICPQLSKISSNFSGITDKLRQNLMGT